MNYSVYKRHSLNGIGYTFSKLDWLINIISFDSSNVEFAYMNKTYKRKVLNGKYGFHFKFGNSTYYIF